MSELDNLIGWLCEWGGKGVNVGNAEMAEKVLRATNALLGDAILLRSHASVTHTHTHTKQGVGLICKPIIFHLARVATIEAPS